MGARKVGTVGKEKEWEEEVREGGKGEGEEGLWKHITHNASVTGH